MSLIDAIEEMEEQHPKPGQLLLCELDQSGDIKYVWDVNDPEDVQQARETFARLRDRGRTIYRVGADGEPTTIMTSFEPEAGKLIAGKYIAAPKPRGG